MTMSAYLYSTELNERQRQKRINEILKISNRAAAELAAGGSIRINYALATIDITLSSGEHLFYEEKEANKLFATVPTGADTEDYLLATASNARSRVGDLSALIPDGMYADRLGAVRAQIATLEAEVEVLKEHLIESGMVDVEGAYYHVTVSGTYVTTTAR